MGTREGSPPRRRLVETLILAAVYGGTAYLGLSLSGANANVTAVWPPTGIAIAALVIRGRWLWPGIALGALAANLLNGLPVHLAAGLTVGNTLAPLAAHAIIQRLGMRPTLERVRDVVVLFVWATPVAMLVSATLGTAVLHAGGAGGQAGPAHTWLVWWVGDAAGVVFIAPLVLTLASVPLRQTPLYVRRWEAIAVMSVTALSTLIALEGGERVRYMILPLALWSALRFEQQGAALTTALLGSIAIANVVVTGSLGTSRDTDLLLIQGLNATLSFTLLAFGATIHERRTAQQKLEGAAAELEDRVRLRTKALAEANERLESEVAEHRRTVAALRDSEERFEQAQRLAKIGSFQWDARSDQNSWSDELFGIYHLSSEDGPPGFAEYLSFIREDVRESVAAKIEGTIASGSSLGHEYPIVLHDGTRKWVHAYIQVLRGADGSLQGLRGTCQDITERKMAERASRSSETRFRALLESAPDAVIVVDATGTIVLTNHEASNLLGYDKDELVGKNVEVLLSEDLRSVHAEHRSSYLASPGRRPMGAGRDLRARRKDGNEVPVDISLSPVKTDEGMVVFALMRDASERRAVEDALRAALDREREAAEDLRKLDQTKNAFLSAVSHELRTPLTAILGFAELLQEEQVRDSEEMTTRLVESVRSNAERLATLLSDLLDVDRLHRGILEPRRRPTPLRDLVIRSLQALNIGSHSLLATVEDTVVNVDPAQAERIVENLIQNAAKYTGAGTEITLSARGTLDGGLELVVTDQGPGIPPEVREAIFEPFFREDTGLFTQGTGIGLALVQRFARLHGGDTWVEEAPGGGSEFHVLMPGETVVGGLSDRSVA